MSRWMCDELDRQDYGYPTAREVVSVRFICRQHFYSGKRFLSGDNDVNHLFVWGDGDEGK